ncbi:MAG: stage 0 sporulation protein [Clostridia bacterium]|nr:stage 0 sporulation protein [Clostridia bacterium]
MQQKVGVRFKIGTKVYTFLADFSVNVGDNVIVETSLGQGYATVDKIEDVKENEDLSNYKNVLRVATKEDDKQNEINMDKERTAIATTKELVEKMNLDMNVVNAEYSFDGTKVIIDFISDNRVDFRDLVKDLAVKLKTRIELRQIGIRDQAKMVGGIGICGRVCCCASHLKDFEKVSIKMAKVQGLALNPTKISGSCGRLMCCLEYENEYYSEVYPKMPKLNAEVKTPDGVGIVMYTNALKQIASVKLTTNDGGFTIKDYLFDDISKVASNGNNNQGQQQKGQKTEKQIKVNLKPQVEDVKEETLPNKNKKNKHLKNNK